MILQSGLSLIQRSSDKIIHISDKPITSTNIKGTTYRLPLHVHKHQVYLLEQHSIWFKIWSAIIRINTEGKSMIMKLGPGCLYCNCWNWAQVAYIATVGIGPRLLILQLLELGPGCLYCNCWNWTQVAYTATVGIGPRLLILQLLE